MTSNWCGFETSCMQQLSMIMSLCSISGYSAAILREVSKNSPSDSFLESQHLAKVENFCFCRYKHDICFVNRGELLSSVLPREFESEPGNPFGIRLSYNFHALDNTQNALKHYLLKHQLSTLCTQSNLMFKHSVFSFSILTDNHDIDVFLSGLNTWIRLAVQDVDVQI